MAYKNYRPEYEFLWKLGFIEIDNGEDHPYDRLNELKLSGEAVLRMDAFWDFYILLESGDIHPLYFECDVELVNFINAFIK